MLSALTVGAGAFLTADPPSEARGDTPVVHGTPATEWHGDPDVEDAGTARDTPDADADLSDPAGDAHVKAPANHAGTTTGDGPATGGGRGDVPRADAVRTGGDDHVATPGDAEPRDGDAPPEPDPADPPVDPDPGDEPSTESPSEPAGSGTGDQAADASQPPTDADGNAPDLPTPTQY
jgi:hypothetical protein